MLLNFLKDNFIVSNFSEQNNPLESHASGKKKYTLPAKHNFISKRGSLSVSGTFNLAKKNQANDYFNVT